MKLSIIPIDGTVVKDGVSFIKLKFETCNIPSNVHALQWRGSEGWIEDVSPLVENQKITELPNWANQCLVLWKEQFMSPQNNQAVDIVSQEYGLLNNEQKLLQIKIERNSRLEASDWTQLPDVIASRDEAWVNAWKYYRQALRDLPANITNYDDVFFPMPPRV
jgi:hypothetical protein